MNKTLDFCLVGAPKCGTTSLFNYLKPHPEVFLPKVKEPHYYCTDFPGYRRITTSREYESIFARSLPGQKLGEASVFYLYSKDAVRNLIQEHPACKIVAILRRPIEMLQSYHQQLTNGFRETELDFEKAWQLRHERSLGKTYPSTAWRLRICNTAKWPVSGIRLNGSINLCPNNRCWSCFTKT
ncbi:MAG: hypothetical protein R3C12_22175 [Planctomycetaceae bacterium]